MFHASTTTHQARVYTTTLNIHGHLHVSAQADISSMFNHQRPFFPMTACAVYKKGAGYKSDPALLVATLEYLIIPKETVLWVGGLEGRDVSRQPVRNLYLLYEHYVLKGEVSLPGNARLSDFLSRTVHEKPFQYLFNVEVRLPQMGKPLLEVPIAERLECVLVNIGKAAGLFDISEDKGNFDLSGF